jgi:hypothetical protein
MAYRSGNFRVAQKPHAYRPDNLFSLDVFRLTKRFEAGRPGQRSVRMFMLLIVMLSAWALYVIYATPWLVRILSPVHDFPY